MTGDGITCVRVVAVVCGVRADGKSFASPAAVCIRWRSSHDKLHQVYINGRFGGVSYVPQQRMMIAWVPGGLSSAVRIEVYAAEDRESQRDLSWELPERVDGSGIRLSWPRKTSLPYQGSGRVYCSGGDGQINYDEPVSCQPVYVWQSWMDKGGFGMSRFGAGDFGYEGCAAVGCGRGNFGLGEFGFDADECLWQSGQLEGGKYRFAVKVFDQAGRTVSVAETGEMVMLPEAKGMGELKLVSYNKETDGLVLGVVG